MTLSGIAAWTCYWIGDAISKTIEPLFGRWFEWPYRLYSFFMCASDYWQGDGADGPWSPVEKDADAEYKR